MFDSLFNYVRITTNINGTPYLRTIRTTVGTDSVDFALPYRYLPAMGEIIIEISSAIPEGTTATLPVRFTMGGTCRNLTFFGGENVTAGDLAGVGVIKVFRNWFTGTLQLTSPLAPATA